MFGLQQYNLQDISTYRVYRCIVMNGPISKRKIQDFTGLSWGCICNSTVKLLQMDVIKQNKQETRVPSGRIPSLFEINDEDNFCIGIDATQGRVIGVVTALNGARLCSCTKMLPDNYASSVAACIMDMLADFMSNPKYQNAVKGIGIALPSIVVANFQRKGSEHPFIGPFPSNLRSIIQEKYGVLADIYCDPDCMLNSEIAAMQPDESHKGVLEIRWSRGIGSSMFTNGQLYHGANGYAGELGHVVVDPEGEKCTCGKQGCLETYASVRTLLSKANEAASTGLSAALAGKDNITFEDLNRAFEEGDIFASALMQRALDTMAQYLANMISIMDPDTVIISGEFARISESRFNDFTAKTRRYMMHGCSTSIIKSALPYDAAATGAALFMADAIYHECFDTAGKDR